MKRVLCVKIAVLDAKKTSAGCRLLEFYLLVWLFDNFLVILSL